MILLSEFLNNPIIKEYEERCIDSTNNFMENAVKIYEILFQSSPDPIIFSNKKTIYKNKILGNVELNKKGLHLYRYWISTYAAKHRTRVPEFLTDGIVFYENFLDKETHEKVLEETQKIELGVNKQPYNLCARIKSEGIQKATQDYQMLGLIKNCVGVNKNECDALYLQNNFVQSIINSPKDNDIQKVAHSDIFFPAVKWWYFPHSVKSGEGTFKYQDKYTIGEKFAEWLYEESISIASGKSDPRKGSGNPEGSIRLLEEEMPKLGIGLSDVEVEGNTLVIANVQRFHRRGDTVKETKRIAIHGSIRLSDPFSV